MSSGSFTSPGLDFNNTGGGTTGAGPPCPTARYETGGRGVLLAGLCCLCGRVTCTTNAAGQAEHEQIPALAWTWDMVLAEHATRVAALSRPRPRRLQAAAP